MKSIYFRLFLSAALTGVSSAFESSDRGHNESKRSFRRALKGAKNGALKGSKSAKKSKSSSVEPTPSQRFEVWGSDQSNSVPGQISLGVKGSWLWIYDSDDIDAQLAGNGDATPLPCTPNQAEGPCNACDVFPKDLKEARNGSEATLEELGSFGRLHGMLADPQNRYVTANFFVPGGGYVGIIDTNTKEAVALFRLSKFATAVQRSVHLSFWTADGSAILCANLHGKVIERINITRDTDGTIVAAAYDRGGAFSFGTDNAVIEEAAFFTGSNAFGNPLLGGIEGSFSDDAFTPLTPNGYCKEDNCGTSDLPDTGRGNNVPICTIPSSNGNVYVNFGGGGLLVLDPTSTPMKIVGEYDRDTFNGAGLVGAQAGDQMFMNAGVSAGGAGFEQSTFTVYSLDDTAFNTDGSGTANAMNIPAPRVVFKDINNTNTIGNVNGTDVPNPTGQIPGVTTRRDSHDLAAVSDGKYIHSNDRVQNNVEVFDSTTYESLGAYDLTSVTGKDGRPTDPAMAGACLAKSVSDDPNLIPNDPAPDLMGQSPDGRHLFVGLRGPAPVTVGHSAQGSCPGIGIIEVTEDGESGRLIDVIRTTNTVDTAPVPTLVGGIQYAGAERSDVHMAIVVTK